MPHNQPQACGACGAGGTATCVDGEFLGPCQPPTAQALDACGNGCDDDRDGEADEGCAGNSTFDYCERNPAGGYVRWTCGCGDGLNVGYCLGSGDSQASCSGPNGCLKAPSFGLGGSQAGGNFQCCVSSKSCSEPGYIAGEMHCVTGSSQNFQCAPGGTSCEDSNACGNTCAGIKPQIDLLTGAKTLSGTYCAAGPVCAYAQGGFGNPRGGPSASDYSEWIDVIGVAAPPRIEPKPGSTLTTPPPEHLPGRDGPSRGGGRGGGSGGG
ncbi:hypothetical protein HPC50_31820, partial [Corallococcus exiguus]